MMHSGNSWSSIVDGTAQGPTGIIHMHDGDAVVTALWDDERGVQVTYEVPDFAMTREEVYQLRSLVDYLLMTPAPNRASAA